VLRVSERFQRALIHCLPRRDTHVVKERRGNIFVLKFFFSLSVWVSSVLGQELSWVQRYGLIIIPKRANGDGLLFLGRGRVNDG